ncbi:FmdB family transcriptional regulator [Mycobacterium alsense]|uniref:FmdB family transcriptional regulator n=1 Tax=Mycobacterium alsense TaxID=324058 RepID=A0AA41XXB1_9MYCO|nr:FmdB family zinc ribbon protein [Mycobacterium alsense]MCV7382005.1 FmdB family transcriptional regulator [Mycobacterium alsense]OQZ91616.1 FmdB family transcriptional regulator [Mycobacterium alsense]
MPTYSYACTQCADRFDVVQAFTDDALTTCEKCSGRLRKLFNSVGVVFKGSGFYRTDSRADGKKSNGSTNGSGESASASGSGEKASGDKSGSSASGGSGDKGGSSEKSTSTAAPAAAAAS